MEVEIVSCDPLCKGHGDLCLFKIAQTVKSGKMAFMLHSEHIKKKVLALGYQIRIQKQNDIPVGLYIYK